MRDALRYAFAQCAIETIELDEKSLQEVAVKQLRLSIAEIDERLKGTTKPWRKEQKLAGLSAWLALAAR